VEIQEGLNMKLVTTISNETEFVWHCFCSY